MSDEQNIFGGDGHETAARAIAYIRPMTKAELPNAPESLPDGPLYALHDENGRPLAVFKDRATAIVAARSNDFTPVSVH